MTDSTANAIRELQLELLKLREDMMLDIAKVITKSRILLERLENETVQ